MEEKEWDKWLFLKNQLCIKVTCWRVKIVKMFKKGKKLFWSKFGGSWQKKKEKETTQNPLGEKKTKLLGPVKFNLF